MLAVRATALRPAAASQASRGAHAPRRAVVVYAKRGVPTPTKPRSKTPSSQSSGKASDTPGVTEVMAFSGPAPETVNGRLAMLGFVAALGAELASGESVLSQIATPDSQSWILYTFILLIGASLIPIFKGVKKEAVGPFSPYAELINGRAAMIGFASLLIVEAVRGGAALF